MVIISCRIYMHTLPRVILPVSRQAYPWSPNWSCTAFLLVALPSVSSPLNLTSSSSDLSSASLLITVPSLLIRSHMNHFIKPVYHRLLSASSLDPPIFTSIIHHSISSLISDGFPAALLWRWMWALSQHVSDSPCWWQFSHVTGDVHPISFQ